MIMTEIDARNAYGMTIKGFVDDIARLKLLPPSPTETPNTLTDQGRQL